MARRLSPAVQPTAEDAEVLESVRAIAGLLRAQGGPGSNAQSPADLARQLSLLARQLAPLVPELAPGIGYTGAQRSLLRWILYDVRCIASSYLWL